VLAPSWLAIAMVRAWGLLADLLLASTPGDLLGLDGAIDPTVKTKRILLPSTGRSCTTVGADDLASESRHPARRSLKRSRV